MASSLKAPVSKQLPLPEVALGVRTASTASRGQQHLLQVVISLIQQSAAEEPTKEVTLLPPSQPLATATHTMHSVQLNQLTKTFIRLNNS